MSPAKKKAKSRSTKEAATKKQTAKPSATPTKKKRAETKPKAEKKKAVAAKAKAEPKKPVAKAKSKKGALDRAKETVKKGVAALTKSIKTTPTKPVVDKAAEKKKTLHAKEKIEKAAKPEKSAEVKKTAKAEKAASRKKPTNVRAATPIQTTQFGNKYICFACQAKFYDLNRPDPICPKCGADQNLMPKEEIKIPKKPVEKKPRAMSTFYDDDEVAADEVDASVKSDDLGFEDEFLDDMGEDEVVEEDDEL